MFPLRGSLRHRRSFDAEIGDRDHHAGRTFRQNVTVLNSIFVAAEKGRENLVDLDVELWQWGVLLGVITAMLLVDLLVVHKEAHEVETREAAIESIVWISCGVAFTAVVAWWFGAAASGEYISGFLIEKSLSIDNVFVWAGWWRPRQGA